MYFAALERIDVSVLALLIYTYPGDGRRARGGCSGASGSTRASCAALALASGGLVLLMASAADRRLDPLGTCLGLATAVVYSVYILTSQGIAARVRPQVLAALVCTGAAFTLTVGVGRARLSCGPGELTAEGWFWLACLALVSTVARDQPVLRRAGDASARRRRRSCRPAEPLMTVVLAFFIFGEVLTPIQLAGGVLVLGGVVVLKRPRAALGQPAGPTGRRYRADGRAGRATCRRSRRRARRRTREAGSAAASCTRTASISGMAPGPDSWLQAT